MLRSNKDQYDLMEEQFSYCLELYGECPPNFWEYDDLRQDQFYIKDYKNYFKTQHLNVCSP